MAPKIKIKLIYKRRTTLIEVKREFRGGFRVLRNLAPTCQFLQGVPTINPQTYKQRADI